MKITGFILALAISPLAFSSQIMVSKNIEVLAVNGVETETSFLGSNKIEVDDGKQQIVVRYSRTFGKEDLIESKPYIFNIDVDGDTKLNVDKFNSKSHAKSKINKDLTWHVTNANKDYKITGADQLIGNGFMPYSDIEELITEYNQKNNISTLEAKPSKANVSTTKNGNVLIEQYKVSTKAQKKQFKMWLIENETN